MMGREAALVLCAMVPFVFAAGASPAAQPAAAPLEAKLSQRWVALGQTFELSLRAVGNASDSPDLGPLERDFHVGGVNRISQTTISNGRLSKHQEWRVQLRARREGTLTIPSIEIPGSAGSASAPLRIEVGAPRQRAPDGATPPAAAQGEPSILVEAEVDREAPYVQGQVLLTVRIASDRPILSGSLTEPEVAGASIERIGEDRSYEEVIDGRTHRIIEREYAIFPQQSGRMRIPPITFEGQVHAPAARQGRPRLRFPSGVGGSIFDELDELMGDGFFTPRGRGVSTQTDEIVLDVQPRPEDATARWWLPAEHLKLSEEWDREPETLQVGEQVTRKFVIQAFGVSRDQIPEIALPEVSGVKQYPEPVNDQTVRTEDGLASVKVQKTVLIPTEPGEFVLPAVELAWFDTSENRERIETLPERRIRVVAGDAELAGAPAPAGTAGGRQDTPAEPEIASATGATPPPAAPEHGLTPSAWIALGVGASALGLLGVVALLRRRRRSPAADPRAETPARRRRRDAERALARACNANDAEAAARALCDIDATGSAEARAATPGALADRIGDVPLRAAVESLQAARFGNDRVAAWQGAALWNAYERAGRATRVRDDAGEEPLPSLYPGARTPARS